MVNLGWKGRKISDSLFETSLSSRVNDKGFNYPRFTRFNLRNSFSTAGIFTSLRILTKYQVVSKISLFSKESKNTYYKDTATTKKKSVAGGWKAKALFAFLDLRSDSTTVPLVAAKLGGPRDAFHKGFQKISFLSILKKEMT